MINSSTLRRMVHSHVDCARACSVFLFLPTRRAGLFFFFQAEDGIRDKLVTGVQTCAFFFQAEDGIRDKLVTGVQTCALPISGEAALGRAPALREAARPPPGDEWAVPACEMVGGLRGPRRLPGPLLSEHCRLVRRLRPAAPRMGDERADSVRIEIGRAHV